MTQSPYGLLEFSSIISNFAITAAALSGIYGLWTWRRELIGKTKFKVARKMMRLALRFRDEYGRARNFWMESGEWSGREKSETETRAESDVLNRRYAHFRRLEPLVKTLRKFYEVSWEAEVLLTEENANLVELFEKLFQDLYIAIGFFYDEQLQHLGRVEDDQIKLNRNIIYGVKGDEVSNKVESAADTVKNQLKKYIR